MNAEIVTIGTELLLGEIVDTNSAYLARAIRDIGLDLYYLTTVGDNEERAAAAISAAMDRADIVITTGGLGPTVDDVTRPAVARATGRPLQFRPDLLEQIAERFSRWGTRMSPNNRQQAYVPAGAIGLENPVGTAPCFIVETERGGIISLPGVPREMIHMMEHSVIPYLQERMGAPAVIVARNLRTAGIGESRIDAVIADLERLSNPTVGLAAHAGQTDIRITAKASSAEEAEAMIEPIAQEIRDRLGIHIYGEGTDTVEEVLLSLMKEKGLTLAMAEAGTEGLTGERLTGATHSKEVVRRKVHAVDWPGLASELGLPGTVDVPLGDRAEEAAEQIRHAAGTSVGLVVLSEWNDEGWPTMAIALSAGSGKQSQERGYGG
ncbi:MAG: CinA family nicotinamide mononucleotide deamidase-related protein, partial [Ardenticatenales bacterium]|nr:CinA family nicotinamide mononucleotide deamidase-related protein [Ardenticatenales bacterium]